MSIAKHRLLRWLSCRVVGAALILCNAIAGAATAEQSDVSGAAERRPLHFKPEPSIADPTDAKVLVTLAVLIVLAFAILWWLKKKYPVLGMISNSGSKLKLVETRAITPRLTLHLVEVKGEDILLAQSGDLVMQVAIGDRRASAPVAKHTSPSAGERRGEE